MTWWIVKEFWACHSCIEIKKCFKLIWNNKWGWLCFVLFKGFDWGLNIGIVSVHFGYATFKDSNSKNQDKTSPVSVLMFIPYQTYFVLFVQSPYLINILIDSVLSSELCILCIHVKIIMITIIILSPYFYILPIPSSPSPSPLPVTVTITFSSSIYLLFLLSLWRG